MFYLCSPRPDADRTFIMFYRYEGVHCLIGVLKGASYQEGMSLIASIESKNTSLVNKKLKNTHIFKFRHALKRSKEIEFVIPALRKGLTQISRALEC